MSWDIINPIKHWIKFNLLNSSSELHLFNDNDTYTFICLGMNSINIIQLYDLIKLHGCYIESIIMTMKKINTSVSIFPKYVDLIIKVKNHSCGFLQLRSKEMKPVQIKYDRIEKYIKPCVKNSWQYYYCEPVQKPHSTIQTLASLFTSSVTKSNIYKKRKISIESGIEVVEKKASETNIHPFHSDKEWIKIDSHTSLLQRDVVIFVTIDTFIRNLKGQDTEQNISIKQFHRIHKSSMQFLVEIEDIQFIECNSLFNIIDSFPSIVEFINVDFQKRCIYIQWLSCQYESPFIWTSNIHETQTLSTLNSSEILNIPRIIGQKTIV
jgi:hypothetical protein